MRIVVVGRPRDVRGFSLAGVETSECRSAGEAPAEIAALAAPQSGVGLLIVSAWAADAARAPIAAIRAQHGPPVVLELPSEIEDERP
jgi:vacuolar-type H+-ATPase subunit F/Vma7